MGAIGINGVIGAIGAIEVSVSIGINGVVGAIGINGAIDAIDAIVLSASIGPRRRCFRCRSPSHWSCGDPVGRRGRR